MARKKRRKFTAEFKAEVVALCGRGDRSVGQVSRDLDLTETAVREWVRQAGTDAGEGPEGALTSSEKRSCASCVVRTASSERTGPSW